MTYNDPLGLLSNMGSNYEASLTGITAQLYNDSGFLTGTIDNRLYFSVPSHFHNIVTTESTNDYYLIPEGLINNTIAGANLLAMAKATQEWQENGYQYTLPSSHSSTLYVTYDVAQYFDSFFMSNLHNHFNIPLEYTNFTFSSQPRFSMFIPRHALFLSRQTVSMLQAGMPPGAYLFKQN